MSNVVIHEIPGFITPKTSGDFVIDYHMANMY